MGSHPVFSLPSTSDSFMPSNQPSYGGVSPLATISQPLFSSREATADLASGMTPSHLPTLVSSCKNKMAECLYS